MSEPIFSSSTKMGAAVGAITIFIANIRSADLIKTILLAATGAVVSFFISLLLKEAVTWWNRRKQ
jgi:hypothetical protein